MEDKEITTVVEYNALGATLSEMANEAKAINEPNKELRTRLQKARTRIEKIGKFLREDYVRMSKEVLAKEKELIGIIEPEEKRLKALEEEAERKAEAEKRRVQLPERIEKLNRIGDGLENFEDMLLDMDDKTFDEYYNGRVTIKNNKDRAELERREREIKEKEEAVRREAEIKAREEQARIDERARLEREEVDRKNREVREAEEAKIREEQEAKKHESDIAYQMFLASHGYDEDSEDFVLQRGNLVTVGAEVQMRPRADGTIDVRLYKLVGKITI
jgi:hypothetical protein